MDVSMTDAHSQTGVLCHWSCAVIHAIFDGSMAFLVPSSRISHWIPCLLHPLDREGSNVASSMW